MLRFKEVVVYLMEKKYVSRCALLGLSCSGISYDFSVSASYVKLVLNRNTLQKTWHVGWFMKALGEREGETERARYLHLLVYSLNACNS